MICDEDIGGKSHPGDTGPKENNSARKDGGGPAAGNNNRRDEGNDKENNKNSALEHKNKDTSLSAVKTTVVAKKYHHVKTTVVKKKYHRVAQEIPSCRTIAFPNQTGPTINVIRYRPEQFYQLLKKS
jgi:hypothetical protein